MLLVKAFFVTFSYLRLLIERTGKIFLKILNFVVFLNLPNDVTCLDTQLPGDANLYHLKTSNKM